MSTAERIAELRKSYERSELSEDASHADPLKQFDQWLTEAISAAIPDIVDEEELATGGIRREGSFFGMQSFVSKLGGALGLALVGGVLSLIGFQAGAPQQSEQTLDWIRILFSYFRALGYFIAFLLLIAYPLTQARVAATRVALNARAMGAAQSQR